MKKRHVTPPPAELPEKAKLYHVVYVSSSLPAGAGLEALRGRLFRGKPSDLEAGGKITVLWWQEVPG